MSATDNAYPSLPQAWVIFALVLAVSIVMGILVTIVSGIAGPGVSFLETPSVSNFIAYNISMIFASWFAWRNAKQRADRVFHFDRVSGILYPLLVVITIAFAIVLDPLTNLIPMPELMERLFALLASRDIWTFMLVCITGPILEEVLFRGIILDGFLRRYKPGKAIFWSAFLFALLHLNPWQSLPAFLIGLLLGYVYLKTRSLSTVILIHMINNSFSYIIMYIYGEDTTSLRDLFTETGDYAMLLSASALVFIVTVFLLYRLLSKKTGTWTYRSGINSS
jgi:membrane protease YdiL (CAAX protease family)